MCPMWGKLIPYPHVLEAEKKARELGLKRVPIEWLRIYPVEANGKTTRQNSIKTRMVIGNVDRWRLGTLNTKGIADTAMMLRSLDAVVRAEHNEGLTDYLARLVFHYLEMPIGRGGIPAYERRKQIESLFKLLATHEMLAGSRSARRLGDMTESELEEALMGQVDRLARRLQARLAEGGNGERPPQIEAPFWPINREEKALPAKKHNK